MSRYKQTHLKQCAHTLKIMSQCAHTLKVMSQCADTFKAMSQSADIFEVMYQGMTRPWKVSVLKKFCFFSAFVLSIVFLIKSMT